MSNYRTRAAFLSGAICGNMWMPEALGGFPHSFNLRSRIGRFSEPHGVTFRDILLHELMERGGDFQNARFTSDTTVRVERVSATGPGKYTVHVWERDIASLPNCADLVAPDTFASDYFWDGCGDE